jgi:hypothetical protein
VLCGRRRVLLGLSCGCMMKVWRFQVEDERKMRVSLYTVKRQTKRTKRTSDFAYSLLLKVNIDQYVG